MCRFKPFEDGPRCGSHPGAFRSVTSEMRVPDKLDATQKATLRALKLFYVGLVLQGGFFHRVRSLTFGVDIAQICLMGIPQQCSIDSPQNGPLPPDAPSWCQAPFDPEGFLRLDGTSNTSGSSVSSGHGLQGRNWSNKNG
ncbi:hypothetical protein D1007_18961 [Hordeum vulgare]|nr:hypothetical protein D1007_18961 [Hordeum vulgare]